MVSVASVVELFDEVRAKEEATGIFAAFGRQEGGRRVPGVGTLRLSGVAF